MRIENNSDLRAAYHLLSLASHFAQHDSAVKNYCDNIKCEIRAYNTMLDESHDVIIHEDADSVVELCEVPDGWDPEDYFNQCLKRTYIPRDYDCTGQLFTVKHKIFVRRGKTMIYHIMDVDC